MGGDVWEERQQAEGHKRAGRVGVGCVQIIVCGVCGSHVCVWFTCMQVHVKTREQPHVMFYRCHIVF